MYYHEKLGKTQQQIKDNIRIMIESHLIVFGGNKILKIYGTLQCKSGKKMKIQNRVFFLSIEEAQQMGYRPCAKCMRKDYERWKEKNNKEQV